MLSWFSCVDAAVFEHAQLSCVDAAVLEHAQLACAAVWPNVNLSDGGHCMDVHATNCSTGYAYNGCVYA